MAHRGLAEVLAGRVAEVVGQVRRADALVADGHPEGIHDLRVSFRRLRGILDAFGKALAWPDSARLRGELVWAARELSGPRDLEVVQERLGGRPDAADVDAHVRAALAAELVKVVAVRGTDRWDRLMRDVDGLPARSVTGKGRPRRLLRHEWRRLVRRAERADGVPEEAREQALHEVRKAAKRTRYAAETLEPLLGDRARLAAEVARSVQESLGDHRDTLLTRGVLPRLRHTLADPTQADRLAAEEERAGEAALAAYGVARERLRGPVD